MHRLFISIDIPRNTRLAIADICGGIPGARWVDPDQIHLTLRFIGEVDSRVFAAIRESLHSVVAEPFSLIFRGVGYFPPHKQPNVLWVGVDKNETLIKLQRRIERCLIRTGLPRQQRRFHPHVTIGRLEPSAHLDRVTEFLSANSLFSTISFNVVDIHLYSSFLQREGSLYIREESYLFARDVGESLWEEDSDGRTTLAKTDAEPIDL